AQPRAQPWVSRHPIHNARSPERATESVALSGLQSKNGFRSRPQGSASLRPGPSAHAPSGLEPSRVGRWRTVACFALVRTEPPGPEPEGRHGGEEEPEDVERAEAVLDRVLPHGPAE